MLILYHLTNGRIIFLPPSRFSSFLLYLVTRTHIHTHISTLLPCAFLDVCCAVLAHMLVIFSVLLNIFDLFFGRSIDTPSIAFLACSFLGLPIEIYIYTKQQKYNQRMINTHTLKQTHTHTTHAYMHNRAVDIHEMKGVGHGLGTITSDRGRAAGLLRGSNTSLRVGPLAAAAAEEAAAAAEVAAVQLVVAVEIHAVPPVAAAAAEVVESAEEEEVVESAAVLVVVAEVGPIAGAARGVAQTRLSVRGTRHGKQPQNIPGERDRNGERDA